MDDKDYAAHRVPHKVDSPVPVMFWEPLEFIVAVAFLGFGILIDSMLFGMIASLSALAAAQHLKRGSKRGAVPHFIWWAGLSLDSALAKWFPPAEHNDFLE